MLKIPKDYVRVQITLGSDLTEAHLYHRLRVLLFRGWPGQVHHPKWRCFPFFGPEPALLAGSRACFTFCVGRTAHRGVIGLGRHRLAQRHCTILRFRAGSTAKRHPSKLTGSTAKRHPSKRTGSTAKRHPSKRTGSTAKRHPSKRTTRLSLRFATRRKVLSLLGFAEYWESTLPNSRMGQCK
ncbi:MAG: hypothetical protein QM784_21140 [Polyangiaceae bacterium]